MLTLLLRLCCLWVNCFPLPFVLHLIIILNSIFGLAPLLCPFPVRGLFCQSHLGWLLAAFQVTQLEMGIYLALPLVVDVDGALDHFEPAVVASPAFPAEAFLSCFGTSLARGLWVGHQWSANISTRRVAVDHNAEEFATLCLLSLLSLVGGSRWASSSASMSDVMKAHYLKPPDLVHFCD